jgi:uncharacterized membrane protein
MVMALIAMVGLFVSLYLALYKFGILGQLTCSVGSCEAVQTSRFATLLGLPVAAWGVGFYLSVLVLALAGTHERWSASRAIGLALATITGWGVLFSAYLTYLEAFVIGAWCQWCVVSAILTLILFVLSVVDLRRPVVEPDAEEEDRLTV